MEHSRLLKLSTTFAILIFTAFIGVTSVSASTLEMSVFEDYKSSDAVLDGNYEKAIELAIAAIDTRNSYRRTVEATTLCVAYTKSKLLVKAETYCDLAIQASRKAAKTSRARNSSFSTGDNKPISIVNVAKNNHEVLFSVMTKLQRTAEL